MPSARQSTKWTRSLVLVPALAITATIFIRRTCSVGRRLASETLLRSGARYFSINSGATNIVSFNQNPDGDFGDWLSTACPQAHPYVQNAFGCAGQYSDIAATSPEGVNLDVVGYDLVTAAQGYGG